MKNSLKGSKECADCGLIFDIKGLFWEDLGEDGEIFTCYECMKECIKKTKDSSTPLSPRFQQLVIDAMSTEFTNADPDFSSGDDKYDSKTEECTLVREKLDFKKYEPEIARKAALILALREILIIRSSHEGTFDFEKTHYSFISDSEGAESCVEVFWKRWKRKHKKKGKFIKEQNDIQNNAKKHSGQVQSLSSDCIQCTKQGSKVVYT